MTEQMTTTTYRTYLEELALSRGLSGAEELAERTHQAHPVYSAQQILECPPGGFGSALDDTIALSEEERDCLAKAFMQTFLLPKL